MQTLGLSYRLTVRDANGRIVSRTRLRKAHSWLRQFMEMLLPSAASIDTVTSLDTGNTSRTLKGTSGPSLVFDLPAGATASTYGPVVGTGSTAVTISDYALGTQIAHGTGSGQMEYAVTNFGSVVVAGSTASFTVSRVFTNSSGASITVNEIGLYARHTDTAAATRIFCVVRDVVAGGQAVGNTNTLTVEYVVKATV